MRACFLHQNVFALGFGVAVMQTQPLDADAMAQIERDNARGDDLQSDAAPVDAVPDAKPVLGPHLG